MYLYTLLWDLPVGVSAVICVERLISAMIHDVSSAMLNLSRSLIHGHDVSTADVFRQLTADGHDNV